MNPDLAREGLSPEFLEALKARLRGIALPAAEAYFADGGTAFTQNFPGLKKSEMVSRYYNYQPCAVSVLAELAAAGEERALVVVRRIFANTQDWMDGGREREGYHATFQRVQLHMSLAYDRLKAMVDAAEADAWRALLHRTGEDVLARFNRFREKHPALDNRGFGTGINHVALAAESIWKSGEILGRPDWQDAAGGFFDRLMAYGHPDGYFEEHTDDAREGGPSLIYTPLTAGSAYLAQRWRGTVDRARFAHIGAFYRRFVDAHLRPMPFADERANPHRVGPYGLALHAVTPEGRGFLRLVLDQVDMSDPVSGDLYLQYVARLYMEVAHMDTGGGAIPEPFLDGAFRLTVPLGVVRRGGWTAGLSAMKALNREIAPKSDYALDRQGLLSLSHARAGVILEGVKAKHNTDWSTVRQGEDAYPVQTGDLDVQPDGATARVVYRAYEVTVSWALGETARLEMRSETDQDLLAQLPLEISRGETVTLNGTQTATLGDDEIAFDQVRTIGIEKWTLESDIPGKLTWPISPFNPYTEGNRSIPTSWRPLLIIPWRRATGVTFRAE